MHGLTLLRLSDNFVKWGDPGLLVEVLVGVFLVGWGVLGRLGCC